MSIYLYILGARRYDYRPTKLRRARRSIEWIGNDPLMTVRNDMYDQIFTTVVNTPAILASERRISVPPELRSFNAAL